ncbi:UNVERIFIED_CONTAM: hypothetical protein GTU68_037253 [Idotea baltica]|nr:hypothetical protein [Idotea baltica]
MDEIRKGFLKLRRTVQERMSLKDVEEMTPRTLVNPKSVSAAIDYFFGRSELSQVVDQTNPLSMLTHERRLSALGPGGLNRKRAGFEVRDVHISHYGRICPIETPEGTNIGLISSLSMFSKVDDYGFLISPYRKVVKGKVTDEISWLRADEESNVSVAPADTHVENGKILDERVLARYRNDVHWMESKNVEYIDVAPCQMVGVSAALIPFLEHDDANRALMGSNKPISFTAEHRVSHFGRSSPSRSADHPPCISLPPDIYRNRIPTVLFRQDKNTVEQNRPSRSGR